MGVARVWTNSIFGRFLTVAFSIPILAVFLFAQPESGPRWPFDQIVIAVVIVTGTIVLLITIFTSKLVLQGSTLTVTQLFRSTTIDLSQVVEVEPGFSMCGLVIRLADGRTVRTLVSGEAGDEFWTTRAERLCKELEDLANAKRP